MSDIKPGDTVTVQGTVTETEGVGVPLVAAVKTAKERAA